MQDAVRAWRREMLINLLYTFPLCVDTKPYFEKKDENDPIEQGRSVRQNGVKNQRGRYTDCWRQKSVQPNVNGTKQRLGGQDTSVSRSS